MSSVLGPFSIAPLKEAGFVCPSLRYALRNPMKIAKYAQDVVQVGHENLLDYGILRSPIEKANTNLVEGQLIKIDKNHHSCEDALEAALLEIPYGKYALIFVDDRDILEASQDNLKRAFSSRQEPLIFEGIEEKLELRKWLSEPSKRECDVCIVGAQHQSNGIETELVIHVYPADCPSCEISNADPVIISRAKAMFVVATYQRLQCKGDRGCGWKNQNQNSILEIENANLRYIMMKIF